MYIVSLVLVLKFTSPILMLFFPFVASWFNFILDSVDGDILMHFGLDPIAYQTWDKAADYVTYIFMLIVGLRWKIKRTIIILFLLRTIGQILFFITRNDALFILFPNFLEPLFMIYALLLFKYKSEVKAYATYNRNKLLIWIIIIGYKMWNEYNIHIARRDLSEYFFGINN